jgi:hypothetical protein
MKAPETSGWPNKDPRGSTTNTMVSLLRGLVGTDVREGPLFRYPTELRFFALFLEIFLTRSDKRIGLG